MLHSSIIIHLKVGPKILFFGKFRCYAANSAKKGILKATPCNVVLVLNAKKTLTMSSLRFVWVCWPQQIYVWRETNWFFLARNTVHNGEMISSPSKLNW